MDVNRVLIFKSVDVTFKIQPMNYVKLNCKNISEATFYITDDEDR